MLQLVAQQEGLRGSTASYRVGERPVLQLLGDLVGLSISTGMICQLQRQTAALPSLAYDALYTLACTQDVHLNETGRREDKRRAVTIVSALHGF